jgi:DNA-binding SARP family transcriptional activator
LSAYLAAEQGLHPRDQLAALLWPDRGEAEARNSLRSALVYLRQALGDADAALAVTRRTLGLSLSPSLVLDIQVLAQA